MASSSSKLRNASNVRVGQRRPSILRMDTVGDRCPRCSWLAPSTEGYRGLGCAIENRGCGRNAHVRVRDQRINCLRGVPGREGQGYLRLRSWRTHAGRLGPTGASSAAHQRHVRRQPSALPLVEFQLDAAVAVSVGRGQDCATPPSPEIQGDSETWLSPNPTLSLAEWRPVAANIWPSWRMNLRT